MAHEGLVAPPHRFGRQYERLHSHPQRDGRLPGADRPAPPAFSLVQALKVDALTPHLGGIGLAIGTLAAQPFLDTISGGQSCTGSVPIPATFGLLGGEVDFPVPDASGGTQLLPLPGIPLTFDSQFRIPATRFIDIGMGGTLTIEWTAVDPVPPIRTDLAR